MFITLLLNHPFSRVELSSVHPLCTQKVFSLSLITIFTAHPCTSSNFITPIRDREPIPDTAIHGCQQYDGIFFSSCISAQQALIPHLFCECSELVISSGLFSEAGEGMCAGCVSTKGVPFLCSSTVQECSDPWPKVWGQSRCVWDTAGTYQHRTGIHHTLLFQPSPSWADTSQLKHTAAQQIHHSDLLFQISNEHAQGMAKNFTTLGTKNLPGSGCKPQNCNAHYNTINP